jgi:sugar lactone lactonase YvrE
MNRTNTAAFLLAFFFLLSCSKKEPENMDPPATPPAAPPVVTPKVPPGAIVLKIDSFNPKTGPKSTIVTIHGSGFSSKPAENLVTIGDIPATVLTADSSTLTVSVPLTKTDKIVITRAGAISAKSDDAFLYTYTVTTLAGGMRGFADGPAATAGFKNAYGLAVDRYGNIFVADAGNHRIRKITPGGTVSTVAGNGIAGYADGPGAEAQFHFPHGIAVDNYDNLYVADHDNNLIRKISPDGVVSTLAGQLAGGYADGTGTAAKFNSPMDVAVDGTGNVFVTDEQNRCIRKVSPVGQVTTIGPQTLDVPEGLEIDGAGNLYVVMTGSSRICKVTQTGVLTFFSGGEFGFADGLMANARYRNPEGLAIDAFGNIYIGDFGNHAVRKISKDGIVSTVAGGTKGFADGVGSDAKFDEPSGIACDAYGNIYIADTRNSRIRKLE